MLMSDMVKGRFISVNPQRLGRVLLVLLLAGAGAGCSTYSNYPAGMEATIRGPLRAGKKTQYQKHFEKRIEGGREEVLFSMEMGRVAQLEGDIDVSEMAFESAVQDTKEQDDKAVISASGAAAQTGAVLVNDKAIPYRPADYERTFVHHYQALNYLAQQDLTGAGVEVRCANQEQEAAGERYRKQIAAAESGKDDAAVQGTEEDPHLAPVYAGLNELAGSVKDSFQNAATFYLSSVIWEMLGEPNDAYIDCKRALELYPDNRYLQFDTVRLGKRLGMREDVEDLVRRFPGTDKIPATGKIYADRSRLVVLLEEGFVMEKSEMSIAYPLFGADSIGVVSLPMYAGVPAPTVPAAVKVGSRSMGSTAPICNVNALAARALEERMPGILTRQVARAVAKAAAADAAKQAAGSWGSLAMMIYNVASEQADLRSWLTLPANIQVFSGWVNPGTPVVTLSGPGGQPLWSGEVTLAENKTTVLYVSRIDLAVYSHVIVQP